MLDAVWLVASLPQQSPAQDPPLAAPTAFTSRRERRQAERRVGQDPDYRGPERRVGERRAALAAERARAVPVTPAAAVVPPRRHVVAPARRPLAARTVRPAADTPAGVLAAVFAGVLVVALVMVLGVATAGWRGQRAAAPVAAPVAAAEGTLLVALTGPDGLIDVALLGADDGDAVSLLLPGDVAADGRPPAGTAQVPGLVVQNLGVRVDGSWFLTTAGLAELVDAIGGVRVRVDRTVGDGGAVVSAGTRRLTGAQAVSFATRLAAGEQVEARLARLQAVLAGIVDGLPTDPRRLAGVLGALGADSTPSVPVARVADLLLAVRAGTATAPLAGIVVPLLTVADSGGATTGSGRRLDGPAARAMVSRLLPGAAQVPAAPAVAPGAVGAA